MSNGCIIYESHTNEELVRIFQETSSQEAICEIFQRFKYLIRNKCRCYYIPGGDYDDLLQEAHLGLFKAVRDYHLDGGCCFSAFANLCIKRQIITALKQSNRQKHLPLNRAVSLYAPLYGGENSGEVLADVVIAPNNDHPEDWYIMTETLLELRQQFTAQFSSLEANIMALYMDGYTYAEMAHFLHVHEKAITNGMYRVQKKLKRIKQQMGLGSMLLESVIKHFVG